MLRNVCPRSTVAIVFRFIPDEVSEEKVKKELGRPSNAKASKRNGNRWNHRSNGGQSHSDKMTADTDHLFPKRPL